MALSIQYTEKGLKDLKYIVVELKLLKETQHRRDVKGLFMGVKTLQEKKGAVVLTNDPFVWLQKGNHVHMLNCTKYLITSIQTHKKGISSTTVYCLENQVLAMDRLRVIMKALKAENKLHSNGLIDIMKYTGVPEKMLEETAKDSQIKKGTIIPAASKEQSTGAASSTPSQNNKWLSGLREKKKVETTSFKRTTKYTITNALDAMQSKIEAIKNGTYVSPELDKIPADKKKSKVEGEGKSAFNSNATKDCGTMTDLTGFPGIDDDEFLPAGMV